MAYKFLSVIATNAVPPSQEYLNDFQERLNAEFYNAPDVFTIKQEVPFGSGKFVDIDVRINHAISQKTSAKLGDDFKNILFGNLDHAVKMGTLFYFDDNYWIATFTESIKSIASTAMVRRCNNSLNWMGKDGGIYSAPCYIDYKTKENRDYATSGSALVDPSGFIEVVAQFNDTTNMIEPNQRFMFGNSKNWHVFKVLGGGINNHDLTKTNDNFSAGTITLSMMVNYINYDTDDVINGIADAKHNQYAIRMSQNSLSGNVGQGTSLEAIVTYNGTSVEREVVWSSSDPTVATVDNSGNVSFLALGTCSIQCTLKNNPGVNGQCAITVVSGAVSDYRVNIEPDQNYVLEKSSQIFSVYLNLNGIQQSDTFTFALDPNSIPASNYQFTVIDGNHFEIKNNQKYLLETLPIRCTSGNIEKIYYISLKGSW